jgi:hypothetical protein
MFRSHSLFYYIVGPGGLVTEKMRLRLNRLRPLLNRLRRDCSFPIFIIGGVFNMLDRQKLKHSLPLKAGNPSICLMLLPEIARKQDVKIFCHSKKFFTSILTDFQQETIKREQFRVFFLHQRFILTKVLICRQTLSEVSGWQGIIRLG